MLHHGFLVNLEMLGWHRVFNVSNNITNFKYLKLTPTRYIHTSIQVFTLCIPRSMSLKAGKVPQSFPWNAKNHIPTTKIEFFSLPEIIAPLCVSFTGHQTISSFNVWYARKSYQWNVTSRKYHDQNFKWWRDQGNACRMQGIFLWYLTPDWRAGNWGWIISLAQKCFCCNEICSIRNVFKCSWQS